VVSQFIPEETVQEVLHRADIVDILSDYVLLKKGGANFKGLCPFHHEKTPSFTVSPTKGLFYCFGCQASGNVLRFLMQHDNMTFPEAVRLLAGRYGIRMPERTSQHQQDVLKPFYTLHQAATAFFHQCLLRSPVAQQARAYCRQRQITSDVATHFALGYAPASWDSLCREMQGQGFSEDLLVRSGLVVARQHQHGVYDRFRDRLMFPIHDRQGRPVAFGGRYLEGEEALHVPKYVNSPETPIFHKNRTLYGFHLAKQAIRQEERVIIVEGYTDVIACHRDGVTHVVGTLGTALTERHVEMLRGFAKEVILVFDSDAAGGAATERGIGLFLEAGVRVRIVELPEGDDPESFLRQHGKDAFLRCLDDAVTFLKYLLVRARRFHDLQTPAGRADCVSRILPLLRKVDNQVEQWGYVALLAENIGVPVDILQREMHPRADKRASARHESRPALGQPSMSLPRVEYDLLRLILHDVDVLDDVQRHLVPEDFQEPCLRDLYALLLRLIPQGGSIFPHILEQANNDPQRQLLAKMAAEPVMADVAERRKALDDYLLRLQQRRMQSRLHQLKDAIREAERRGDAAEQHRCLEAYAALRKDMPFKHLRGQS
jgi:DNA primase